MSPLTIHTGIQLLLGNGPPDIEISFVPHAALQGQGDEYGLESNEFRLKGFATTEVDSDGALTSASIWISTNLTDGEKWGTVLHELGHALGISGHTDRRLSSLFMENWGGGAFSDNFSSSDRKLLRFLYSHLKAGASTNEVRAAFDEHWKFSSD